MNQWRDLMVYCLLQGTEMGSNKIANFDKHCKITQEANENLAIF